MKPASQREQAGCGEWPKSRVLCMLVRKCLRSVNDTRARIGLRLLVTSHVGQIQDPWDSQVFTYSAYSNWSLATYPLFYSSKVVCTWLKHTCPSPRDCNPEGPRLPFISIDLAKSRPFSLLAWAWKSPSRVRGIAYRKPIGNQQWPTPTVVQYHDYFGDTDPRIGNTINTYVSSRGTMVTITVNCDVSGTPRDPRDTYM